MELTVVHSVLRCSTNNLDCVMFLLYFLDYLIEKHLAEAHSLFDDVVEEFSTVAAILGHFEEWKDKFRTDYDDAYVGLCIPKLLSPLIKVDLMDWNPLQVGNSG